MRLPKDSFAAGVLLGNGSWTGSFGQLQRRVMYYIIFQNKVFVVLFLNEGG